jgi:hypothetical protein
LRVIDNAYEILNGEMIMFSDLSAPSTTFLKMSNAKELPDSTRYDWVEFKSIGTGTLGRSSSGVFEHDMKKRGRITEKTNTVIKLLFFIYLLFLFLAGQGYTIIFQKPCHITRGFFYFFLKFQARLSDRSVRLRKRPYLVITASGK